MTGPGRYGIECESLAEMLAADVVVLLVVNGSKGSGISVAVDWDFNVAGSKEAMHKLPSVLRQMAAKIEAGEML